MECAHSALLSTLPPAFCSTSPQWHLWQRVLSVLKEAVSLLLGNIAHWPPLD